MSNLANTPGSAVATIGGTIALNEIAYGSGVNTIQGLGNFTFDGSLMSLGSAFVPGRFVQVMGSNGDDFVVYSNGLTANIFKINGNTSVTSLNESNISTWKTVIGSTLGDYPFTVKQTGTSPIGYSTSQVGIQQTDPEVGIQLDNTGTGGKSYVMFSTNDSSVFGGGTFIIADATGGSVRFKTDNAGNTEINTVTKAFAAGDIDGTGLQTLLQVDDSTGFSAIRNLNDGFISVPKVTTIGDTSLTDTYIQISNSSAPGKISTKLPAYADNAAALIAGLTTGDLFQTDGTGANPLNVPGIVMIVQ